MNCTNTRFLLTVDYNIPYGDKVKVLLEVFGSVHRTLFSTQWSTVGKFCVWKFDFISNWSNIFPFSYSQKVKFFGRHISSFRWQISRKFLSFTTRNFIKTLYKLGHNDKRFYLNPYKLWDLIVQNVNIFFLWKKFNM